MAEHAERAACELEDASVDAIVYACTSGTFTQSPTFDRDLQDRLSDVTGIPVVTTTTAVVAALRCVAARSVLLATPYDESVNDLEANMLLHHGITVVERYGLGHVQPAPQPPLRRRRASPIGVEPAYASYAIAKRLHEVGSADAIFVSCTNLRTFEVIEALEADTGVSVVTSNQASLWAGLVLAGVVPKLPGLGALLRGDRGDGIEAIQGVHRVATA